MPTRTVLGSVCIALTIGSVMSQLTTGSTSTQQVNPGDSAMQKSEFRATAIRYQVKDVDRSIAFYTEHLGFKLEQKGGPPGSATTAFASISSGSMILWLSGPKSSGSRPMPDGRTQEPGGWNRLVLEVDDLPARVTALKKEGIRFRNDIETGPGGRQIQIEDPDGNPIELFQPAQSSEPPTKDRP